ncbi:MAG: type III pantothenate kinase [Cytophagales bacterium]|nr:type III pantothenate kinase [Cytophagales bacterium]
MNICIDIGNTNGKIGIFRDADLLEVIPNLSSGKIVKQLKARDPENIIVSSVRKGFGKLYAKLEKIADTIVLSHNTPVPVEILYKTPETLGLDRMASVVGAHSIFAGKNCLVIDIGTCITYDLIDSDGRYHGGGISPGVDMRLKAMHKFTSRLPLIAPKGAPELIGKSTKECLLSGATNGTIAELEGIIFRYKQFFADLYIILCGGGAIFFESKIKDHIFAFPNLVLVGLNQILRFNLND